MWYGHSNRRGFITRITPFAFREIRLGYLQNTKPETEFEMSPLSKSRDFWTLSIVRNTKWQKTQRYENWICFRTMSTYGMWRRVVLVRTDVSEEHIASIFRVKIISEVGTTLKLTSNCITLRKINHYIRNNEIEWAVPHDFLRSHIEINSSRRATVVSCC
jgi:hypothetical protein